MRTAVIIQARVGSTRLPAKVLMDLGGMTVLAQVVRRAREARGVDEVIVATTTAPGDDAVVAECRRLRAPVFRGSEDDVLSRYVGAAAEARADVVVRVTSDCPLLDPRVLERMLERFHAAQRGDAPLDYMSNTMGRRTYPRGLDVEIMTMDALRRAGAEAARPYEREHVTPYFYEHPELFRLELFAADTDHSAHRWTLDTPEDLALLRAIFDALGPAGERFTTEDVLRLLDERAELRALNAHVQQKALA